MKIINPWIQETEQMKDEKDHTNAHLTKLLKTSNRELRLIRQWSNIFKILKEKTVKLKFFRHQKYT